MSKPYETRHRIGQHNVRFAGLDVHNPVFFVSGILIIGIVVLVLAFPAAAAQVFAAALSGVTTHAGGLMGSLANLFVLFCLFLLLSPYGSVRLGGVDAKPDFNNTAWFAMLFAAGMGIGLVFYSVAEPLTHFASSMAATSATAAGGAPLGGAPGEAAESARLAMAATIFHWTVHPWSIFAVVALSLALFSFNFDLPLTIRSGFFPLLGDRVWGWPGNVIDTLAIIATVAGLATSLGLGAQQALAGINFLFGIEINAVNQILLVVMVAAVTTLSLVLGLDQGVRRLSELNMILAAALCLFVVLAGPTLAVMAALPQNTLAFLQSLPALSNPFGRQDGPFFRDWTIFYWAWWTAWAPFVGMFIARISRGRTVRQLVFFVVLLPSLVSIVWFTAFGTVALEQVISNGQQAATQADLPLKLFVVLSELPFASVASLVGVMLVLVFFITSWDSGTLVLDTLAAGGKTDTRKAQLIFWVVVVGATAIALLLGGGLRSLQSGSVVTGLPFMLVIALLCIGILRGLKRALALQRAAEQQSIRPS
jgi:BCCT family betaine/carnitine transporter